MKRLGVYVIIIVCVIACRKFHHTGEISSRKFDVADFFPTYFLQAVEYSRIVDAVATYITEEPEEGAEKNRKYIYRQFNSQSVFKESFESNYTDINDVYRGQDILDYAIRGLSNFDQDRLYYMTQLLDQTQYKYTGLLDEANDYVFFQKKEKVQPPYVIYDFGLPLLTANKERAIVLLDINCGPLCGGGHIYLLSKKGSNWNVDSNALVYIK